MAMKSLPYATAAASLQSLKCLQSSGDTHRVETIPPTDAEHPRHGVRDDLALRLKHRPLCQHLLRNKTVRHAPKAARIATVWVDSKDQQR